MVYYNQQYNLIGVVYIDPAFNVPMLEISEDGHGLIVLTHSWTLVGTL